MNAKEASSVLMVFVKVLLISGFIVFCFLRYMESRMLFYPVASVDVFPDKVGLKFQKVTITTVDKLAIQGWFTASSGAKYTILFCHGNAGNISHRLDKLRFFDQLGYNVLIFDYRGYGESQGKPSEPGFYRDVEAAYAYLLSQGIGPDRIIGYGESLGGAVITELAFTKPVRALILDSTFSSIKDMAREIMPWLPSWMLASRFDSEAKVRSIGCPKLMIHSVNDEIVPFRLGQKLYAAAGGSKVFLQVHGGHNSNFYESQDVWLAGISGFIKNL